MKGMSESIVLDSREVAAALANETMFDDLTGPVRGPLSIAVPGEIKGLYTAWERYGTLNWKQLVEPAIALAKESEVPEVTAKHLEHMGFETVSSIPGLEFYIRDGELVKTGDKISRTKLADTLQRIADGGEQEFYHGELAVDIANEIEEVGGIISWEDLENYTAVWKKPIVLPYQYYKLNLPPLPFGGTVVGMILNILEHDKLAKDDSTTEHLIIEAWKWAYGDRLLLEDPIYNPELEDVVKIMTSKDHAAYIRKKIKAGETFPQTYYSDLVDIVASAKEIEDHGTMHMNAIDIEGNMVALTSTVNYGFGSYVVGSKTGIVYNNEMDDFLSAGNAYGNNLIAPGKRPLSSMSPTIITDSKNEPVIAIGASGGVRIITAVMQSLINLLSFDITPGEAVGRPRIHNQLLPDQTLYEEDFNSTIVDELTDIGHTFTATASGSLACSAMIHKTGSEEIYLASDWRKFGSPVGY